MVMIHDHGRVVGCGACVVGGRRSDVAVVASVVDRARERNNNSKDMAGTLKIWRESRKLWRELVYDGCQIGRSND